MKAVRLHHYGEHPVVEEVAEPVITGPWDVIVDVGAAGLCRTDLHIIEGQWDPIQHPSLPYILGHENAGWVREVGSAVHNVKPGDTVIMHPLTSCGLCPACRVGQDSHCANATFPGINADGGMAQQLLTNARAVVKLDAGLQPKDVAALADAGLTAYHAVRKAADSLFRPWRPLPLPKSRSSIEVRPRSNSPALSGRITRCSPRLTTRWRRRYSTSPGAGRTSFSTLWAKWARNCWRPACCETVARTT